MMGTLSKPTSPAHKAPNNVPSKHSFSSPGTAAPVPMPSNIEEMFAELRTERGEIRKQREESRKGPKSSTDPQSESMPDVESQPFMLTPYPKHSTMVKIFKEIRAQRDETSNNGNVFRVERKEKQMMIIQEDANRILKRYKELIVGRLGRGERVPANLSEEHAMMMLCLAKEFMELGKNAGETHAGKTKVHGTEPDAIDGALYALTVFVTLNFVYLLGYTIIYVLGLTNHGYDPLR